MVCDAYDVFHKHKDGAGKRIPANCSGIFCAVSAPSKPLAPALSYYAAENEFRNSPSDWIVSPACRRFSVSCL